MASFSRLFDFKTKSKTAQDVYQHTNSPNRSNNFVESSESLDRPQRQWNPVPWKSRLAQRRSVLPLLACLSVDRCRRALISWARGEFNDCRRL
jgi:hypothetical protein